jgi:hypothetical protein
MEWCLKNHCSDHDKLLTRKAYQQIIRNATVPLLKRTHLFYTVRKRFVEKNMQRWFSLNMPYQPLWNALIHFGSNYIVILTNKNREAVLHLCHHFGLNISESNIYAGDNGTTKIENLKSIFRRFHAVELFFIDDSLRNLQDLNTHFNQKKTRLHLFLASWGFIGPEDIQQARKSGYQVLSQTDLIALL